MYYGTWPISSGQNCQTSRLLLFWFRLGIHICLRFDLMLMVYESYNLMHFQIRANQVRTKRIPARMVLFVILNITHIIWVKELVTVFSINIVSFEA